MKGLDLWWLASVFQSRWSSISKNESCVSSTVICTWRFPVLLFLMRMVSWSSLYVDALDIGLLSTCFSAFLSSSLLICCWNTHDKPHYWWSFRTCSIFNLLVNLLLDWIILKTKTNYLSKQEMSKHSQL